MPRGVMPSTQILLVNYATAHAVADAAPSAHYLRRGGRQRLLDGLVPHLLRSQTSRRQRGEGVVPPKISPARSPCGRPPCRAGRQADGSARSSNSGCVTSSDSPFSPGCERALPAVVGLSRNGGADLDR